MKLTQIHINQLKLEFVFADCIGILYRTKFWQSFYANRVVKIILKS